MTPGPLPRMAPVTLAGIEMHPLLDSAGRAVPPAPMLRGRPDPLPGDDRERIGRMGDLDARSATLRMAYRSFVVKAGDRRIPVDAALGEDGNVPRRPDRDDAGSNRSLHLGRIGTTPEEIDTVLLTHLHPDHAGWLTRRDEGAWVPTFPSARHLASRAELAHWPARHEEAGAMPTSIPGCAQAVVAAGLMDAAPIGDEIAPGLVVVDLAGRSPGMIGLELREGGRPVAAFCADLMHDAADAPPRGRDRVRRGPRRRAPCARRGSPNTPGPGRSSSATISPARRPGMPSPAGTVTASSLRRGEPSRGEPPRRAPRAADMSSWCAAGSSGAVTRRGAAVAPTTAGASWASAWGGPAVCVPAWGESKRPPGT